MRRKRFSKIIAFGADEDHVKLIEKYQKKWNTTRAHTMRFLMTILVNEYDGVKLKRTSKKRAGASK